MRYTDLFFDLDGTLVNTWEGVADGVTYALSRLGIPVPDRGALRPFLGPPLVYSFMTFSGLSLPDAERATAYFREFYTEIGIHRMAPYDGIAESLSALSKAGYRLSVATSKLEDAALRVLGEVGILDFFAAVSGALRSGERSDKISVIRHCLSTLAPLSPAHVLMIGDRMHDCDGTREEGIDTLGVLWGFGSQEELVEHGALSLAVSPADLPRVIAAME